MNSSALEVGDGQRSSFGSWASLVSHEWLYNLSTQKPSRFQGFTEVVLEGYFEARR